MEGRKEGRKECRKEVGRNAENFSLVFKGRRERTKEGRKERRKEGSKEEESQNGLLYKRLCLSVCPSVWWSVVLLVHWSVRNDQVEKWKNKHFGYFLCMFVFEGWGFGFGWGLKAPAHLSATKL